ncbi:MAG: DNA repair protein RecN [Anaeroplasmataceae bacterium]
MLKCISVKNFAIIEDLTVDFLSGMTVLTGQTGAGKSLIIDSISLLIGARADALMIRYGCDKAYIEGTFIYDNPKINPILTNHNIPILDDITIYREISINGKNVIKINNVSVTLVILNEVARYLADIHVQHDTFRLINPDTYLSFIDNPEDSLFNDLLNKYTISLDKYTKELKNYKDILNKRDSSIERIDFITYQYKELKALELYEGIDKELEEGISKLSNYDKIFKSLNEAYENLENEYFSLDNIYNASKSLDKIKEYDKEYLENSDKLNDAYYMLDDVKSSIYKAINNLDFDASELDLMQERLNEIEKIKNKYKMSVSELIDYLNKIELELDLANNYDEVLNTSYKKVESSFNDLKLISSKLTNYRKKESKLISEAIIKECKDLDLYDTMFEITFNDPVLDNPLDSTKFMDNGVDEVSFMISLNKGEPLKPLNKVASGGELSRIMLAFKSYFIQKSKLSLMVFDEIDSGVSGDAALKIAKKIKNISKVTQVLCITHLPSVAAIADNHLWIYKEEKEGRTVTNLKKLDYEERVSHIATMIGGSILSKYSLEAARDMLLNNE